MLRLSARATVIDDEILRHDTCEIGTIVLLDHAQGEIDARGHACRRPDRTVDDEDAILLHRYLRKARLQVAREQPVGGRPPSVEQPSLGEHEGTRADRGHAPTMRAGRAKEGDQAIRRWLWHHQPAGDDGVEISGIPKTLGLESRAEGALNGSALFREDGDVVARLARCNIRDLEGRNPREAHHLKSGRKNDADTGHCQLLHVPNNCSPLDLGHATGDFQ